MTESGRIRVFISYSHDSRDHKDRVLELADRLCDGGLDCQLDQYEAAPPEGWPRWMTNQVEEADFVLVVCTENYNARFRGKAPKGTGLGGKWEGAVITQELYDAEANNVKFVPVLMCGDDSAHIPVILKGATYYDCSNDEGYEQLYRRITGQHFIPKPEIGSIRKLPTKERRTTRLAVAEGQSESGGVSGERFEELTKHARQRMAEAATQWLSGECDPFVMPTLSRRVQRAETMTPRHKVDPWEPLSEDECRDLVLGNLPEDCNRVRIFSPSGMGKTTLLHYCEQQIAASAEGKLPVRVSALSSYDWRGNVVTTLANLVVHPLLPRDSDEVTRVAWLKHLIHERRVVFLFDAVDQTDVQLAGFAQYVQSADVRECPVLVTGRPEVEQTRAAVFHEANWETCRVEPFDEEQIRRYLGEQAEKLLESEGDDESEEDRKQQWADLLKVPLLLRLMRRLAVAEEETGTSTCLSQLHNRHAVYREAIQQLVAQGWTSLSYTPHHDDLLHERDVFRLLSEMAWAMVSQQNFRGVFDGEPFDAWLARRRHAFRALEQVDITTRHSVLDNPQEFGLAWRHLSFCEYFAGIGLTRLKRDQQEQAVREHGRNPSWQWVFRFALSELQANGNQNASADLARDLIRFGNPFLVFDAIRSDSLELPERLDLLCRWLVHRDYGNIDYRGAWDAEQQRPEPDDETLEILDTLFAREHRDSRCLHPAWDLLTSSSDPRASEIQQRFQAEFSELCEGSCAERAVADSLSLDEHFIQCPPPDEKRKTFKIGENAERSVKVKPFYVGKAPITNLQFELFDPSHKQWRDQYSPDDDSPVTRVSWYMAVIYCIWLGEGHRLPCEEEWEIACRAGTTTKFWWGDEFDPAKCNAEMNVGRATPADPGHANDWGLMEMAGNVWEWCEDESSPGSSSRVCRGGSFVDEAGGCRSAFRVGWHPVNLFDNVGFRVSRT